MIDVEVGMVEPALAAAKGRPIIAVPLSTVAASQQLIGPRGWLVGWSLRESGGGAIVPQQKNGITAAGGIISGALTDIVGSQTFLTGFDIMLGAAAAAASVNVTVAGLTNPMYYVVSAVAGDERVYSIRFAQPLPGAGISVALPAIGGAGANNSINVFGYTEAGVAADVELVDGQSAGGELLAAIAMAAGGSDTRTLGSDGIPFRQGLFLSMLAGSVRGAIWVRV